MRQNETASLSLRQSMGDRQQANLMSFLEASPAFGDSIAGCGDETLHTEC